MLLSLKNLAIVDIDKKVFNIENLRILILSYNPLNVIPDEIETLKNLKIFHAVGCKLYDFQIS